jgi:hypothetical protein
MALRGERIGKPSYEILRSLKGGKSGPVHKVDHKIFDRPCVQKTFSTLGLEDAASHREPRALHEIKHPHVVEILEAQYDPGHRRRDHDRDGLLRGREHRRRLRRGL